ncbi:hypothetical protein C0J52_26422 [Blattella germanica]|nr:hypothetical protein C0J52_26422 [Blattella germanica]
MADVNIRERVIALFENGVSASEAGRRYGVDSSTARRWIRRFRDDGESARRPIPGRRRVSTQRQDEELVRAAQIAPFSNIRELSRASHFPGSSRTALKRLKNHGIRSRRALIKEPLSDEQAVDRVAIVSSWEDVDWRKVIFSDECTIESTSKGPVLVYRTDGQPYDARFVATRARSGCISATCWGWMSYMGAGTLERIQGTFNSACYEHFLENVIIPGARLWYPEGRTMLEHSSTGREEKTHLETKHVASSSGTVLLTSQSINWEYNDRSWMQFTIKCPQFEDKDEEIYEDLCYVTFSSSPPEIIARFKETGEAIDRIRSGRPKTVRTERVVNAVRARIHRNPLREQNILSREMGVFPRRRRYCVDSSTARRWIRRFRDYGESARRPIPGRRRVSTQRQDEELVRAAQTAPFSNIRELRRASHFPGSSRTALKRLKNHGIRSRRALIKEPLSDEQAVDRVAIVSSWEDVDWRKVIFSDECTIESTSKGPVLVYRTDGQRYDARFVATRARSGRISVTCWGWMSYMGAGTLERIQGTFNSACYKHFLENLLCCVRMCYSYNDEPSDELNETEEYGSYYSQIRNEEIYQDLCAMGRRAEPPQIPSTVAHSFEKRDYVIKELVETEKNYVDVLTTLHRCFMRPLNNLLREEDMKVIFGGIKELSEIHAGFHSQLRKAVAPGSPTRLSEVFLNWREKFLIYGEYCANLPNAQALIQDLLNVHGEEEIEENNLHTAEVLVKEPSAIEVEMMIEKLKMYKASDFGKRCYEMNHEDYRGLERAKEAMVDVAQYINEVKRDSDTLQIMRSIQSGILSVIQDETKEPADEVELDPELWRKICERNNTPTDVTPKDFIDVDSEVTVEKEVTEEDIINSIMQEKGDVNESEEVETSDNSHAIEAGQGLRPFRPTRWSMRVVSLLDIDNNYEVLLQFLNDMQEEKNDAGAKVKGFLKCLQKFETLFHVKMLIFLIPKNRKT